MADDIYYYQWEFNRWLGSGTRADMSLNDRAIYRDLLDHQAANGSLPDDVAALANRAMCSIGQMEAFMQRWGDRLFPKGEDGSRRNAVMDVGRNAILNGRDKRRSAGVKGAEARWHGKRNGNANGKRIADAMATNSKSKNKREEAIASSTSGDAARPRAPAAVPIRWCTTAGWVAISPEQRKRWAEAYPACDIDRQLRAMDAWLQANPVKAKKSNWTRFIVNWLAKEQDRGGDAKSNRPASGASGAARNQSRADDRYRRESVEQGAEKVKPRRVSFPPKAEGSGREGAA